MGADVLAEKVLREVPEQFLSYMNMKGIKPEQLGENNSRKKISGNFEHKFI